MIKQWFIDKLFGRFALVHSLVVVFEGALLPEGGATQQTGVRLGVGVCERVAMEIVLLAEGLAAVQARVRPLAGVL